MASMPSPYAPPSRAEARATRVLGPRRFLRLYATLLLVSSVFFGAFETLWLMFSVGPFFRSRAAQFVFHDGLRTTSAWANGAALVVALVVWAASQRTERLARRRTRVLWRALVVALPGYLLASSIAIVVGLSLLIGGFGQDTTVIGLGAGIVTRWDFWIGVRATVLGALVIVVLAHFYLARLCALDLGLWGKISLALAVVAGTHFMLVRAFFE